MKQITLIVLLSFTVFSIHAQCDSQYFRYAATSINDIWLINDNIVIGVGDNGYVAKSIDTGKTWRNIHVDFGAKLNRSVFFPTTTTGYITGDNGILKSEDQ